MLVLLTLFIIVKHSYSKSQKPSKLVNIIFVLNKFDTFTIINTDIQLPKYTTFRQKVDIFEEILRNVQMFNSYFIDKIKDL